MTYGIKKHILRDFGFYFYTIVIYQVKNKRFKPSLETEKE